MYEEENFNTQMRTYMRIDLVITNIVAHNNKKNIVSFLLVKKLY